MQSNETATATQLVTVQINESLHLNRNHGKKPEDPEKWNYTQYWETVEWTVEKLIDYQSAGGCVRYCIVNDSNKVEDGDPIYGFALDIDDDKDPDPVLWAKVGNTISNPLKRFAYIGYYSPSQETEPGYFEFSKHRLCFLFKQPIDSIDTARVIIKYFSHHFIGAVNLHNPSRYFYGSNPRLKPFLTQPGIMIDIMEILDLIAADEAYNTHLEESQLRSTNFEEPSDKTVAIYQLFLQQALQGRTCYELFPHCSQWYKRSVESNDELERWEGSPPPYRSSSSGKSFLITLLKNGMLLWYDRSENLTGTYFDYVYFMQSRWKMNKVNIPKGAAPIFYRTVRSEFHRIGCSELLDALLESYKSGEKLSKEFSDTVREINGEPNPESSDEFKVTVRDKRKKQSDDSAEEQSEEVKLTIEEIEEFTKSLIGKLYYDNTAKTKVAYTCWCIPDQIWHRFQSFDTPMSGLINPTMQELYGVDLTGKVKGLVKTFIHEKYHNFKAHEPIESISFPVFANGIFNTDTNELMERNHEHVFYHANDSIYVDREMINYELIEKFRQDMELWTGSKVCADILYYFTIIVIRNLQSRIKQFIQLKGDGGIGKTTFYHFLAACLDNGRYSNKLTNKTMLINDVESRFGSNAKGFAYEGLDVARLVCLDEIEPNMKIPAKLRSLIGSENTIIDIEYKGISKFQARRKFAMIACTNYDFRVTVGDVSAKRRMIIIDFPWTNPNDIHSTNPLPKELYHLQHLDKDDNLIVSMINHALFDFQNDPVMDTFNTLALSEEIQKKIENRIRENDPVLEYLEAHFRINKNYGKKLNAKEIYSDFRSWCEVEGHLIPKGVIALAKMFWDSAEKLFGFNKRWKRNSGGMTWIYYLEPTRKPGLGRGFSDKSDKDYLDSL